jgi:glycosyltransferase involved in cell wall biosynthesis
MFPRLSIVVPSLNQGEHIGATLDCLLAQRGLEPGELQIIVIDGGSTDGTIEILRNCKSNAVQWSSGRDGGQTDALRKGFSSATGGILGWLCADDLLEPWTVREVIDFFDSRPQVEFVYGDAWWIDKEGSPLRPKKEIPFSWFIWLHDHNYIPQPAAFWRRRLYDAVGGLDPAFDLAMDADLFARFAKQARPVHVGRQWARFRTYPAQKNRHLREQSDREDRIIRERLGVSYRNPLGVKTRYCMAKLWRVAWKLALGAYLPGERHL